MKLYMICGKQDGELMCIWLYSSWASDASQGIAIYAEQGDDATGRSRCRSINRVVKKLALSLVDAIEYKRMGNSNVSKIYDEIIRDILSQNVDSNNVDDFHSDNGIRKILFKTIQKYVHIKTMDPFTGKIEYEDLESFMAKDIQRIMQ